MAKSILTKKQSIFLEFLAKESSIYRNFYLTGGTALSEFYLRHRSSEDLDFFSTSEFEASDITPTIKKSLSVMKCNKYDYQSSFNRNIFHLIFDDKETLKVEFTYFPFEQIETPKRINGIPIDSLVDIATNKIFTIHQNPRGRDFFDVYQIIDKTEWKVDDLVKKARIKFDTRIDPLQLGTQFIKVEQLLDDPILVDSNIKKENVDMFFMREAKKLEKSILF